jgi:prepilin-type N-terminal cleavage/methylation domain-containing protein
MMSRMRKRKQKKGFTLVEISIVIAIIGILSGFIYVRVTQSIQDSKIARTTSDLNNAKKVIDLAKQKKQSNLADIISDWLDKEGITTTNPWGPSLSCVGYDLRGLQASDPDPAHAKCIADLQNSWDAIEYAAGTRVSGNPPRDQWDSPLILSIGEGTCPPTQHDRVYSVGPNGTIWNSDDIIVDINHAVCTDN